MSTSAFQLRVSCRRISEMVYVAGKCAAHKCVLRVMLSAGALQVMVSSSLPRKVAASRRRLLSWFNLRILGGLVKAGLPTLVLPAGQRLALPVVAKTTATCHATDGRALCPTRCTNTPSIQCSEREVARATDTPPLCPAENCGFELFDVGGSGR